MKIQVDIPEDLNKQLKIVKAHRSYKNLQETIIKILKEYFGERFSKIINLK